MIKDSTYFSKKGWVCTALAFTAALKTCSTVAIIAVCLWGHEAKEAIFWMIVAVAEAMCCVILAGKAADHHAQAILERGYERETKMNQQYNEQ